MVEVEAETKVSEEHAKLGGEQEEAAGKEGPQHQAEEGGGEVGEADQQRAVRGGQGAGGGLRERGWVIEGSHSITLECGLVNNIMMMM